MKIHLLIIWTFLITPSLAQSKITFQAPKVYPEGIAFDNKNGVTYVSSVKTGTIGKIDASGKYSEVLVDKALKSTFGMKVDEKTNRLWVCAGDPNYSIYKAPSTFKKMARIVAIDLSTGRIAADIDLSKLVEGNHFPNDLTIDGEGNLYITDSFAPAIYTVDTKGNPSVLVSSEMFKSKFVGLNGIVYHPKGYLLVAHNTDGCVFKVDLKNPSKPERVKIDQFFPGADGLWLDKQQNLVLVQNKGVNRVFKLSSTDDWKSAKVSGHTPPDALLQNPTTCGWFKNDIYVLNAKLNELSDSTMKPSDSFSFQQVIFK